MILFENLTPQTPSGARVAFNLVCSHYHCNFFSEHTDGTVTFVSFEIRLAVWLSISNELKIASMPQNVGWERYVMYESLWGKLVPNLVPRAIRAVLPRRWPWGRACTIFCWPHNNSFYCVTLQKVTTPLWCALSDQTPKWLPSRQTDMPTCIVDCTKAHKGHPF